MRRLAAVASVLASLALGGSARAAENLRLAPGLSFVDDSNDAFPIRGDHLDDATLVPGRAALVFFGASHCWNTNREAERVVAAYGAFRDRVTFVVVDVGHPGAAQWALVREHYHGYIPTVVVLGRNGRVVHARSGETAAIRGDAAPLSRLLAEAVGD